jgi:hypothetical protein
LFPILTINPFNQLYFHLIKQHIERFEKNFNSFFRQERITMQAVLTQTAIKNGVAPQFLEYVGMHDERHTVGKMTDLFNITDHSHPRFKSTLAFVQPNNQSSRPPELAGHRMQPCGDSAGDHDQGVHHLKSENDIQPNDPRLGPDSNPFPIAQPFGLLHRAIFLGYGQNRGDP